MTVTRMSMKADISTQAILKELGNMLTPGELAHAAGEGADVLADEVRRRAPGSIAEAVESGVDKVGMTFGAGDRKGRGFVTINYKKAPHAHLVEYGTAGQREPKEKKLLKFIIDGKVIFSKSVKPMPAAPFMRPAYEDSKGQAAAAVAESLTRQLKKKGLL